MSWPEMITVETDDGDILDVLYAHDRACRNVALAECGVDYQTISDAEYEKREATRDGVTYSWGQAPIEEQDTDVYCAGCGALMRRGMEWYAARDEIEARYSAARDALAALVATVPDVATTPLDDAAHMFDPRTGPEPAHVLAGIIEWAEQAELDALGSED